MYVCSAAIRRRIFPTHRPVYTLKLQISIKLIAYMYAKITSGTRHQHQQQQQQNSKKIFIFTFPFSRSRNSAARFADDLYGIGAGIEIISYTTNSEQRTANNSNILCERKYSNLFAFRVNDQLKANNPVGKYSRLHAPTHIVASIKFHFDRIIKTSKNMQSIWIKINSAQASEIPAKIHK